MKYDNPVVMPLSKRFPIIAYRAIQLNFQDRYSASFWNDCSLYALMWSLYVPGRSIAAPLARRSSLAPTQTIGVTQSPNEAEALPTRSSPCDGAGGAVA